MRIKLFRRPELQSSATAPATARLESLEHSAAKEAAAAADGANFTSTPFAPIQYEVERYHRGGNLAQNTQMSVHD